MREALNELLKATRTGGCVLHQRHNLNCICVGRRTLLGQRQVGYQRGQRRFFAHEKAVPLMISRSTRLVLLLGSRITSGF